MSKETVFEQFVSKGWGYEKIIVNGPLYCGKILHIVKGRSCSLHYHKLKTETFFINDGEVLLIYFDKSIDEALDIINVHGPEKFKDVYCTSRVLKKGDYFHLNPGLVHKMVGLLDSNIIEFSTADFTEDSYRVLKGD